MSKRVFQPVILPSVLAADMGRLRADCQAAEQAGADGLHVDVMDGRFVGNLSLGPDITAAVRAAVGVPLSVHLMVQHPGRCLEPFIRAGAHTLLIHVEAAGDIAANLRRIRELGARAGVVLNPETPWEAAQAYDGLLDEILCMSVHPGFGGQKFLGHVTAKVQALRSRWPAIDLSVDGGLDAGNVGACARAGANIFIVGTSVFRAPDLAAAIQGVRSGARI